MAAQNVTEVVLLACGSFNPITIMHLRMFELAREHLEDTGQYSVVSGIISPVGDAYKKKGLIEIDHRLAMAKLAADTSDWITVDSWESLQPEWVETARVVRHHYEELLASKQNKDAVDSVMCTKKRRIEDDYSGSAWHHYEELLASKQNKDAVDSVMCTKKRRVEDDYSGSAFHPTRRGGSQLMLLCGADVLESFSVPNLWKQEDIVEIVGRYGLVCITRSGHDPKEFVRQSDVLWKYRKNIHVVDEWVPNEISATRVRRGLRRGQTVRYFLPDAVLSYIKEHNLYSAESEQKNADMVLAPLQKFTGASSS